MKNILLTLAIISTVLFLMPIGINGQYYALAQFPEAGESPESCPTTEYRCTVSGEATQTFCGAAQCDRECVNDAGDKGICTPLSSDSETDSSGASEAIEQQDGFLPLVTCGGEGQPNCTLCHLFQMGHNIINFLFYGLMLPVTAIAFIIGGILLLTAAGNETNIERGKSIVWNTFLGILIAFSAWLIVNTIIVNLTPGTISYPDSGVNLEWYEFPGCQNGGFEFGEIDSQTPTSGGGGGGSCNAVTSGPCSVENLQNTCFGENAENASIICNKESAGRPQRESGVDICTGDGSVVSFGLFQINISANQIGGLNCPAAFDSRYSGSNKNCRVIDEALYNECVAAAKNAAKNIQTACRLSGNGTNFSRDWVNNANACQIP